MKTALSYAGLQIAGWISGFLALSALSGAALAADKIIYVRPVPQNEDLLLKQGSAGVAQAGLMYGLEASTLESQANRESRQQQLEYAIRQKPKFIVLMGYEFSELIAAAAGQAPQVQFLWLEHCPDNPAPNLYCVQFRESETAYLAGLEAGSVTSSGKVGVLGPVDSPARRKSADAFAAGAKAARPDIQLHPMQWVGGAQPFNDNARSEQVSKSMLGAGVDVIYAIAGASNLGVIRALEAQGGKSRARMIGHPVNQCHMSPGKMLDSVEVHFDTAIALAVGRILRGDGSQRMEFGLKENALALAGIGPDAALSECEVAKDKQLVQKIRKEKSALMLAR
ncbi:MAG: BMP family ABC transporter substrate-binding protein [Pseudomonadota bacterium]